MLHSVGVYCKNTVWSVVYLWWLMRKPGVNSKNAWLVPRERVPCVPNGKRSVKLNRIPLPPSKFAPPRRWKSLTQLFAIMLHKAALECAFNFPSRFPCTGHILTGRIHGTFWTQFRHQRNVTLVTFTFHRNYNRRTFNCGCTFFVQLCSFLCLFRYLA